MRKNRIPAAVLAVLAIIAGTACDGKPVESERGTDVTPRKPEYDPLPEKLVLEVERGGIQAPFEIEENPGASAGRCVVLPEVWATSQELNPACKTREGGRPVSKEGLAENPFGRALVPNGTIEIPFRAGKPGRYTFWARAWFSSSCGDSFELALDEDPPVDTDGDGTYDERPPVVLSGSTHKRWKWFKVRRPFDLAEGPHVLRIYPREDGIRIDQVLFAEEVEGADGYVPQGVEEPTGEFANEEPAIDEITGPAK